MFSREDQRISLPDGDDIIRTDMMAVAGSWDEVNRNVYRVRADGSTVWQIQTRSGPDESVPYTDVNFDGAGILKAYSWDGGEYTVNLETGAIGQGRLVK